MNAPMAPASPIQRVRLLYALLLIIFGVFVLRLFYLQVIRFDHYKAVAQNSQLKEATVRASRGIISAHMGDQVVPLVLNQKLYTLYADPTVIKDPSGSADKVARVIGESASDIEKQLRTGGGTRYVVLKRKLTPDQSSKIVADQLPGIGTQEQDYRTYPQGSMAAQLLGFVNNDGDGKYGIEQALNSELKGKPGELKAVTDVNGVPLAANSENLSTAPVAGKDVTLTVDMGMQQGLEKILQTAQQKNQSKQVSGLIIDVHTGAIKAMANYPSYDPANYQNVQDASLFQNATVSEPIEPGSITKVFTVATSLQKGAITPTSSFYDPGSWSIDGAMVKDVEEDHSSGQQTILSTLDKSLNTGATWMLMQLGGGKLDQTGRSALYDYFANHFLFGKPTGIEQGYESGGYMPGPTDTGAGINLTYANISFGQAYTATALQMGAGLTSILNGGTYYQPYLVDQTTDGAGRTVQTQPKVVKSNVITKQVSDQVISLLEQNNTNHIKEGFGYLNFGSNYNVGGKTGTAEIADPNGGYYNDRVNGTYMGFVGGDTPQYAIVVYNFLPTKYTGFAGAGSGQPVFADIAHMLVNNFGVTPKSH